MKNKCGDNINSVHKMVNLFEWDDCLVAYCERCKEKVYIRKDEKGRPEPKYAKLFKRDLLQPGSNLYYKEYPNRMHTL